MILRLAGSITAAAVLLLLSGCMVASDPHSVPSSDERQRYVAAEGSVEPTPAPGRGQPITLSGTTLDGDDWTLASVSADEVIVVTAWGSWCDPCRSQVAEVERAARQLRAQDMPVQVVGLDFMEDPNEGRNFQFQHELDFPSLSYAGGKVAQAVPGGIPTVPTTLVLDQARRIAARVVGTSDADTLTQLITDVERTE